MQVFQTAGAPPRRGNTILPIMGSMRNIRNELRNNAGTNSQSAADVRWSSGLDLVSIIVEPRRWRANRSSRFFLRLALGILEARQGTLPRQAVAFKTGSAWRRPARPRGVL